MDFSFKEKYSVDDLREIMKLLRSENGCPWDREQDHASIRNDLLEEAYETLDAIDSGDKENLCEELGDLLLQVMFHSRISEEDGDFDFDDVADGICKKLIIRHPHVFGDVVAETSEQVLTNWDAIKMETKNQTTYTDTLLSVPKAFPALMRAKKVQKRASKAGYDWPSVDGVLEKTAEELGELCKAVESGNQEMISEEIGDLLFTVVNITRFTGTDPELALASAVDKFTNRFAECEKMAIDEGIDLSKADPEKLDALWNKAKKKDSNRS